MGSNVNKYKKNKTFRVLEIERRLSKGEFLNKVELAENFKVAEKTIQRDIDELRAYLSETCYTSEPVSIKYDRMKKGYYLTKFEQE